MWKLPASFEVLRAEDCTEFGLRSASHYEIQCVVRRRRMPVSKWGGAECSPCPRSAFLIIAARINGHVRLIRIRRDSIPCSGKWEQGFSLSPELRRGYSCGPLGFLPQVGFGVREWLMDTGSNVPPDHTSMGHNATEPTSLSAEQFHRAGMQAVIYAYRHHCPC